MKMEMICVIAGTLTVGILASAEPAALLVQKRSCSAEMVSINQTPYPVYLANNGTTFFGGASLVNAGIAPAPFLSPGYPPVQKLETGDVFHSIISKTSGFVIAWKDGDKGFGFNPMESGDQYFGAVNKIPVVHLRVSVSSQLADGRERVSSKLQSFFPASSRPDSERGDHPGTAVVLTNLHADGSWETESESDPKISSKRVALDGGKFSETSHADLLDLPQTKFCLNQDSDPAACRKGNSVDFVFQTQTFDSSCAYQTINLDELDYGVFSSLRSVVQEFSKKHQKAIEAKKTWTACLASQPADQCKKLALAYQAEDMGRDAVWHKLIGCVEDLRIDTEAVDLALANAEAAAASDYAKIKPQLCSDESPVTPESIYVAPCHERSNPELDLGAALDWNNYLIDRTRRRH